MVLSESLLHKGFLVSDEIAVKKLAEHIPLKYEKKQSNTFCPVSGAFACYNYVFPLFRHTKH